MPFTIRDFEDLVRLLYEHPEWRERLRSVILPEEILTLPQLVRENSEAIGRLEQAVAELVELHNRMEKKIEELVETQRRGYEEFLAYRQATDTAFRELAETVRRNHDELRADVEDFRVVPRDPKKQTVCAPSTGRFGIESLTGGDAHGTDVTPACNVVDICGGYHDCSIRPRGVVARS